MFLKKCASEVWEARKKGRQGNEQLATDLGERGGNIPGRNLPQMPNMNFIVVIH